MHDLDVGELSLLCRKFSHTHAHAQSNSCQQCYHHSESVALTPNIVSLLAGITTCAVILEKYALIFAYQDGNEWWNGKLRAQTIKNQYTISNRMDVQSCHSVWWVVSHRRICAISDCGVFIQYIGTWANVLIKSVFFLFIYRAYLCLYTYIFSFGKGGEGEGWRGLPNSTQKDVSWEISPGEKMPHALDSILYIYFIM